MRNQDWSIEGKTLVATGVTSGIGKEIARAVVSRGAHLMFLARNTTKAEMTALELANLPGARIEPGYVLADLADFGSVRRAAHQLVDRFPTIDVLVNNAGIHARSSTTTIDGLDAIIATNHLGPFLLTNLLLGRLMAATQARIVNTTSEAYRAGGRIDLQRFGEPGIYGPLRSDSVYCQSKLLNVLFTAELADRLAETGVTVSCYCPGVVASGLLRERHSLSSVVQLAARTPLVRRPKQGAQMGIRLIVDGSLQNTSGIFYSSIPGFRLLPRSRLTRSREAAQQAWERSLALVGPIDDYRPDA